MSDRNTSFGKAVISNMSSISAWFSSESQVEGEEPEVSHKCVEVIDSFGLSHTWG